MGRKWTLEQRQAMRESKLGNRNPNYGKQAWNRGRVVSEETRRNLRESHLGIKMVRNHSREEEDVREAARLKGERHYFFPRACKLGHISKRWVRNTHCYQCHIEHNYRRKAERARTEPEFIPYNSARQRAKDVGLGFSITLGHIRAVWPKDNKCPILGIELERNEGKFGPKRQSPSLDRIIPEIGYVPGNIAIISHKANLLKQNETDPAVFDAIAEWLSAEKPQAPALGDDYRVGHRLRRNGANDSNLCSCKTCICNRLFWDCRLRARKRGIKFDLSIEDVQAVWPVDGCCPILHLPLQRGTGRPIKSSPTLDRRVPNLGYVRGNISVISYHANLLKSDETDPSVFQKLAKWMRQQGATHA